MRRFFLFLSLLSLAVAGPAPGRKSLHELMTEKELMQVFQTKYQTVPEYEVIPVYWPRRPKRSYGSSTTLELNAFGCNIRLWLNPLDDILAGENTPVYTIESKSGKLNISKIQNPMDGVGKMLEDREARATLMVKETESKAISISGTVGLKNWVVRPLPNSIDYDCDLRFRRSVNNVQYLKGKHLEPFCHVVYKQPERDPEAHYAFLPVITKLLNNLVTRSKRDVIVPEVIYPQVLVFADYATYKLHGENLSDFLVYMLPFWNGVDLRYRSLENPRVRFNIAGIVIGKDPDALPFVSNHLSVDKGLYFEQSLPHFSNFLIDVERSFPKDSYDVAVAIVPYKLCSNESHACKTLGYAFERQACNTDRTSIVLDMGAFDGVVTAVHEIGHLFSLIHDGQNGSECKDDGFIMTPNSKRTVNVADWSPCSLMALNAFFRGSSEGSNPSCLFNKPNTTHPLPRVMPGRLLTMDEQCHWRAGTKHCNMMLPESQICVRLFCDKPNDSSTCVSDMAPVDGTICAAGKICIRGKCLPQSLIL